MSELTVDYHGIQVLGQEIRTAILDASPSLRDQFAMAALQGLLAWHFRSTCDHNLSVVPKEAYSIADAMLKDRQQYLEVNHG